MKFIATRGYMCQIHCAILIACFIITLVGKLFFTARFGVFTLLALILPIVGLVTFFMDPASNFRKELFLIGRLSSCFSLLFLSQNLFRTAMNFRLMFGVGYGWGVSILFWNGFYFLLTTGVVLALIYFLLLNTRSALFRRVVLQNFFLLWVFVMCAAIFFYRVILIRVIIINELILLSYLIWLLTLSLTIITCYEVKILIVKRC